MDAGQIKEFDSPLSLFDNPKSTFRSMCEAASLSREAILRIRAGDYVHEVQEGVQADI
jgi:ATP-binding cassette subfamily C (CFTR/MRP) protein 1